jgi:AcrR family transcriptional regulator
MARRPARAPARAPRVPRTTRRPPSAASAARVRRTGETKSEATRRTLLERALVLFQQRGVDATTMRDIAHAADLSLGAAYYYFPSKDALLFAYYEQNQQALDQLATALTGDLRDRLGTLLHGKLVSIRPHRAMLASILPHLVNPHDPVSAFSRHTRDVRDRAIATFARVLGEAEPRLPPDALALVAHAFWLLSLVFMLMYVHDDSAREARTHGLVDDALDLVVPMLPLLATPPGRVVLDRLQRALARAGLPLATG